MNATPSPVASGERWAAAALDHFLGLLGYMSVPEGRPTAGGWRRLYVKDGGDEMLAAVGGEGGGYVSVGVEVPIPRGDLDDRLLRLIAALAAYEVAIDPDAGADPDGGDAVLRIALRLFSEGMTSSTIEDAVANVIEAAAEARSVLST